MKEFEKLRNWFENQSPITKTIIYFWIALIALALIMQIPNPKGSQANFPSLNTSRLQTNPVYNIDIYTRICRDIYLMHAQNRTVKNITCWNWQNGTCICIEPM